MGSRTGSHKLSNGLYVSGRPEQHKERQPTVASRAVPYTGGDVKKSGELGRMYGVDFSSGVHHPGPPMLSGSNSGQMVYKSSSSGSGPIMTPIQPTGLITSGPLSTSTGRRSGQLEPARRSSQLEPARRSSQLEPAVSLKKVVYGSAVTSLSDDIKMGFGVSRVVMWVLLVVLLMALMAGAFAMAAMKKPMILVGIGGVLAPILVILLWNFAYKERGFVGFLRRYGEAELRGAVDGQYVKVTGVVTCGSIPLETSFQRIPRCVYASTELYEYKGWSGKSAHPRHCCFLWGRKHSEKYVADFYISDFQTGLRALVKAGYGAKVAPFVKSTTVVDITKGNRELSPDFVRWLAERSLSSDNRTMQLKEGYIKEGSTVSVMGAVRRHENVLMIVPPEEPRSTGWQLTRCLLPTYAEGLILTYDDIQNDDVIPV